MALRRNSTGALLRSAPMTLATGGTVTPPLVLTRYYLVKWRTKIYDGETLLSDVETEFPDFRIQETQEYVWTIWDVYGYAIKEEYWAEYGEYRNANVFFYLTWGGDLTVSYDPGYTSMGDPVDPPPAVYFEPFASEIYVTPGPNHLRYEYYPVSAELTLEQYE